MLDLHRLFLLRELAARGTVSAVAEALHYSRSAVSQQLGKLEQEAGVELYEHVGRVLQLTDAGRTLLEHAERLLAQAERAEIDLENAHRQARGLVQLGIFQTAAVWMLPDVLTRLQRKHPDLRVAARQAGPEQTLPALRLGDLDAVVGQSYDHSPLLPQPELHSEILLRDPVRVALPKSHRLSERPGPVDLRDLKGEIWVSGQAGTGIGDMAVRICLSLGGFTPEIRYYSSDLAVMQSLVAGGHAVALIPGLARAESHQGVVVRDLQGVSLGRDIFVATRTTSVHRPTVQALILALHEASRVLRDKNHSELDRGPDLSALQR